MELGDKSASNSLFSSPFHRFLLFSEKSILIDQEQIDEIRSDRETDGAIQFHDLDHARLVSFTISMIRSQNLPQTDEIIGEITRKQYGY